ncbi:hypothetical protein WDW86_05180 [Bdellovibrionota bacterium FG-2]
MKLRKTLFILMITLGLGHSAFADNWCHIGGVDGEPLHPNFSLAVDYQVNFNGASFEAKSIWINLYNPQMSGKIFARVINHYFFAKDVASPFVELRYDDRELKYSSEIPSRIDLGGRMQVDLEVWQTLELRYGSLKGPLETRNLNMSKGHLDQDCFRSLGTSG